MKAKNLKDVDLAYVIHKQAHLNFIVQATKKSGKDKLKPVYDDFEKFFNYEKELNKVLGKEIDKYAGLKAYLKEKGGNKHG